MFWGSAEGSANFNRCLGSVCYMCVIGHHRALVGGVNAFNDRSAALGQNQGTGWFMWAKIAQE